MNSQASEAVKARALAVLRRARLAPFDFRYMTTAYLKNNRLRHISVVKLPDGDFIKLSNMGVLRKLHEVGEDMSKEELIRHVIYGLSPFTILLEQKAA